MRIIRLFAALVLTRTVAAQTPDELKAGLPLLEGWAIDSTVEVFNPDNLFERINGAAPGYLLFDFRELAVFVYNRNGDDRPYITVQAYRHASGSDAFGIYASERPEESNFLPAGTEGYMEGSILNFFAGCMYVKIDSPSQTEETIAAIRQIALTFGRNIEPEPVLPAPLQKFPVENRIAHSELYIPSGFLGHEFLNRAFTADYRAGSQKYRLFVIDAGSVDAAKETLTMYYRFTKQTAKPREGRLTVKDRFNGDIECLWEGRYILGIVNDGNAAVKADAVLKEAEKNLTVDEIK